jgi:serine/threonine protein kinase
VGDLSGEIIDGRYELVALVATGGMASIYSAIDLRLDRPVAVKIMHAHLANDEEFVNRFIKEAKASASLNHPNVVAIQDQGWNQGGVPAVFLVMEYIDGFTLRDVLNERGALAPPDAIRLFIPVLNALAAAHKIGISHRDIKPENILIAKDGRIKVADFGLARGESLGNTMTAEASVIMGSVSYLSPEQVQRGVSDSRSDVYSLGILLFEMLTGQKPYDGGSAIQIAYRHVTEKVPPPSSLKADIPSELDELILTMTCLDPDKRPRNANEVLSSVRDIQAKIDPNRKEMTLELDIPPLSSPLVPKKPLKSKKSKAATEIIILAPISGKDETMPVKMKVTKRKSSPRVLRNRMIALGIAVMLGIFGWSEIIGPGSKISVPSVVGLSTTEATALLSPLGLQSDVTNRVYSEEVPNGKIITSSPGGGGHIVVGGFVHLTISKGKERIAIPQINGLTPDVAAMQIANVGLKIGTITQIFNSNIPKGFVISVAPGPGVRVQRNTFVNLIVSKGVEKISTINYVGLSGEQALNELETSGFVVTSNLAYSDTIATGAVISQTPAGGRPLPKGSEISLVVSEGPAMVFIPNVYSLSTDDATRMLENLQLKVIVKQIGKHRIKTVTNVSPIVGSKVAKGTFVTITVG